MSKMFENSIIMFVFSPITHCKGISKKKESLYISSISIVETWSLTYFLV